MIILTLIEPKLQTILKEWRFEQEMTVQVGRADDNQVILNESLLPQELMSLVSRHHLTLQQVSPTEWQLTSQGSNGTFLNGVPVQQSLVKDGMQLQLARGGPILKIQLQDLPQTTPVEPDQQLESTLPESSATPQHISSKGAPQATPPQATPQSTASETIPLKELQAQLEAVTQQRDRLQATLQEIQAQFPATTLSDRQITIADQLNQLQQIQMLLKQEETELQNLPQPSQESENLTFTTVDRDRLCKVITEVRNYFDHHQTELQDAKNQVQIAIQAIEKLTAHLQANQAIANHLPDQRTRSEALAKQIQQTLQEFDQELARLQELHATANAKQFFSL